MTSATIRAPRRDAVRNHERIIAAARDLLGELGPDTSMEQIAARAGVGVGTVYRRFPGKELLVDELIRLEMIAVIEAGQAALRAPAGRGLEQFLWTLGHTFADHRRYAGLLLNRGRSDCGATAVRALLAELVEQARAAGTIGPDVALGDVMTLIWGLRAVVEMTGSIAPAAWQRHLDIHLGLLRAAAPLSSHPVLTPRQLARVSADRARSVGTTSGDRLPG